ncbi:hypothetical protein BDY19DRAFT_904882 [Irpex rosettiformis]|uniref:Uncharacterized protein n=1 Tax=Irpex rosettiformis TaxID=378272 RepID=A0ACB8U856_9APHY|nr:hypothetical protein BDY19DRAFT_904882 [Irpex rosettiformis]
MPIRYPSYQDDSDYDSDTASDCSDASCLTIDEDEILPMDDKAQEAMGDAAANIRMCNELFTSWNKELTRLVRASSNVASVVEELQGIIQDLLDQSSEALRTTKAIIRSHCGFSKAFYRALRQSAKDGRLEYTPEMEKIVAAIQKKAGQVSNTIARMQDSLSAMAEVLEEAMENRDRERGGFLRKAAKWLRKAFNAVACLLGLGATLANILCQPHVGVALGVGSALSKRLALVLGKVSSDGKLNDAQAEKLFEFLKNTLAQEVSSARDILMKLDDCQTVLSGHFDRTGDRIFKIDQRAARDLKVKWQARHLQLKGMTL